MNSRHYNARLESITDSLITKNENLQSAVSTVMDADVAAETANYIKNQLLQQTASSLLTQANQAQGVLALKLINALA
ncbi:MAG: flagellin [Candidatus Gastranaerophilaceae bacterium]